MRWLLIAIAALSVAWLEDAKAEDYVVVVRVERLNPGQDLARLKKGGQWCYVNDNECIIQSFAEKIRTADREDIKEDIKLVSLTEINEKLETLKTGATAMADRQTAFEKSEKDARDTFEKLLLKKVNEILTPEVKKEIEDKAVERAVTRVLEQLSNDGN
jgi:hypothetical protein